MAKGAKYETKNAHENLAMICSNKQYKFSKKLCQLSRNTWWRNNMTAVLTKSWIGKDVLNNSRFPWIMILNAKKIATRISCSQYKSIVDNNTHVQDILLQQRIYGRLTWYMYGKTKSRISQNSSRNDHQYFSLKNDVNRVNS